ncbi:MAG: DUF2520 domain-containing protein [Bacteroidetes bacterium]|nr:DUF2520 domain-containing protein [Bacteroidota bacterium]
MIKGSIHKVVLIGAGNFATNLALAMREEGFDIMQLYNRTEEHGKALAERFSAPYINNLKEITPDADLYIISVNDNAIEPVAAQLNLGEKLIIHTSGSIEIDVLKPASSNFGAFHSPQTFSKLVPVSFRELHVSIEANNKMNEDILVEFAGNLSDHVHRVNELQRRIIHLAAIFTGNFSNFMYTIAADLLKENKLPFDIMKPILKKTIENAFQGNPFKYQTGPAIRENYQVMSRHLELLAKHPDYKDIYDLVSRSIIKHKV